MLKIKLSLLAAMAFCLLSAACAQGTSWHKTFTATIDKYPVTIQLHRTGQAYSGFYYYEKTQQPVQLGGSDSTETDSGINLYAFVPGSQEINERFVLTIRGDSLTGEWIKAEGSPALRVNGRQKKDLPLNFDVIYTTGSTELRPKLENSPEANYHMASIWPREKSAIAAQLKARINRIFGDSSGGQQEIGQLFLKNKKAFFASYLADYKTESDSTILEFPSGFSLSEEQSLQVVYQTAKLLTLASFSYAFTGGAHGNYGTSYVSINLANGKPVMLSQVLTAAGVKQLNKLLEKNFRKQYGVPAGQPLTEGGLFDNKIEANDNFYLTGKGIGFNYVPYEIAAYAVGEVNIFIPYTDLAAWLQPAFKLLIK